MNLSRFCRFMSWLGVGTGVADSAGMLHEATDALDMTQLYRDYAADVTRWAARLVHSPNEAEDLAHEVFLVVQRRAKDLAAVQNFSAWLYQITVNVVRHA